MGTHEWQGAGFIERPRKEATDQERRAISSEYMSYQHAARSFARQNLRPQIPLAAPHLLLGERGVGLLRNGGDVKDVLEVLESAVLVREGLGRCRCGDGVSAACADRGIGLLR